MSKKHRRDWEAVRDGAVHPGSGYQASLVKLESTIVFDVVYNLVSFLTWFWWWGLGCSSPDPRFRVVLTGHGDSVGVAEARSRRRGLRELQRVDDILATRTHDQVRAELGLDF